MIDANGSCTRCHLVAEWCECPPLPDDGNLVVEADPLPDEPRTEWQRRLVLTPASEIEPEPVIWAWEDNGAGAFPQARSACSPDGREPARART